LAYILYVAIVPAIKKMHKRFSGHDFSAFLTGVTCKVKKKTKTAIAFLIIHTHGYMHIYSEGVNK